MMRSRRYELSCSVSSYRLAELRHQMEPNDGVIGLRSHARQRRYDVPVPTWKCPHCGFVHHAADLLRLNFDELQCRSCGRAFLAVPDDPPEAETRPPADLKSRS